MRQWGLGLGLLIGLLLNEIKTASPGIAQSLSSSPILKNENLTEAEQLNQQAETLSNKGKSKEATFLFQRALIIGEKTFGKNHASVATSLNGLAELYRDQGKYDLSQLFHQRALSIREKVLGENHTSVAASLNNLASLYNKRGKYMEAEPLYQRSLAIWEKILGKDHSNVATSLNNLALLYDNQGKYTEAEPLYQRSFAIREKIFGKDHPNVATSLNNLAALYRNQGKYAEAESLYQRSLAIWTKALGKTHLFVAASLNNLASLYNDQGKYAEAEPLYKSSLAIWAKALGKDHPDIAQSLNNLAVLYVNQGKYIQAERLLQYSLVITEKAFGKSHPIVASRLNNLSSLYFNQGRYQRAGLMQKRSLTILEKTLGKDHSDIAINLSNLAAFYFTQRQYKKAELMQKRSLTILEKALGKDHLNVASIVNNLAASYSSQGQYKQAELLYKRSLAIREKMIGKDHLYVANSLNNLAGVYDSQGQFAQAVDFYDRGSVIEEKQLSKNLVIGSEQNKKDYVDNILTSPDVSIRLAIKSKHSNADRLALTNVLRRQGRILDATAATIQSIRPRLKDRPDLQQLFDKWKTTLQEQAALNNSTVSQKNPQEYQARYQELEQRGQNLEVQLSQQSAIFRQTVAPVELAKIQALVLPDAALVHIVRYRPFNPKAGATNRRGVPRYAAAILRSTGNPHWVDLGAAVEIEKNIQTFRQYLQDGSSTSNRQRDQIARTLNTQLIQPLHQHLGNAKHLLLSPDGALNLIPFEALKDENDKYLIERYAFSYLTSGRDLTRFADSPPSRQTPVIFSGIDYDRTTNFSPLATAAETQAIQSVFPNAQVIRDRAATKAALQATTAPSILHLATHGFFTSNNPNTPQQLDKPLARSGIALAGKDQLTGLEAYGLDLHGTQLVVLSACETGLGDISVGEGIYGLRRALVIAGSQSQVLSLWKVGDQATVELMKTFYANLKAGMGRHEALRQAQLKLLRHPNYQNPFYWAAFIPSGNWEPLPK